MKKDNENIKYKIGHMLQILVGAIFVVTSFSEIIQMEGTVELFTLFGLGSFVVLIDVVKLILGVLMIVKETRGIASLVISSYLGGAIALHLGNQPLGSMGFAVFILILTWVSAILNKNTFRKGFLFKD